MVIVDTNVVSELMKASRAPQVLAWMPSQPRENLFTTSITVAEVLFGIELLPKGKRRDTLLGKAEATFVEDFAGNILTFDEPAARLFALISATRRSQGRPISTQDAQIAGIARAHGAALATRNKNDFEGCGVVIVNPWQA